MVSTSIALLLALSTPPPPDTTLPFADAATRALVERAMARFREQDTLVSDYVARIRYRLSASLGRRRWAQIPVRAVEELAATVQWRRPNDLRVEVIGRRFARRDPNWDFSSVFDHPWFVPRGVGDSVRIVSDEFPATGALHPLAAAGPEWYRYALRDSVQVTPPRGAPVRVYDVEVVPRRTGPALIAGRMWIEATGHQVVRLTFRYVGTGLFVRPGEAGRDSSSARRLNRLANRFVSIDADLEYALQDGKYWMPFRQSIAGRVQVPFLDGLVVPFHAVTTFSDYELNTGRPIAFTVPLPDSTLSADSLAALRRARRDSLRAQRRQTGAPETRERAWDYAARWPGGRYELRRPPDDSLARYRGWDDSLNIETAEADQARLRPTEADLARQADSLPGELTGEQTSSFGYERLSDAFRYDRVQGYSLGLGYRLRVPGASFTSVNGTVRYGFSDERVTGRLSVIRDAPGGRIALSGYRDVTGVDPYSPGATLGNTFNAIFAVHDDADYLLATGGAASWQTSLATGLELSLRGRVEQQRSVAREATSKVNDWLGGDGLFPENPPVDEGTFAGLEARVSGAGVGSTTWWIAGDGLVGAGTQTGRLYGELTQKVGARAGATLRLKSGIATSPTLSQMQFRAGGLATVRGFDYGTQRGQAFWAAQLDVTPLETSIRPVVFVDAGRAAAAEDLFSGQVLVGGGVGVSLLGGLMRFDLSRRLSPDVARLRFDFVITAVR
ncbi:MAG TPA: hypothetical protein VFS33_00625 [Gemmatimonadales bacterium]|nr:hypothetical protein [Gemmatimonadales bacterium]